ncbi:hypothetical protein [Vitiosangium sp. GDMCC 1.1324]|uniref:hypothetical protein n=1 Tax=Vitiosangium sp. (strain GDMCC 1.1324) TaxID=2138576 RepID=UPI000D386DB5|nr:hypothetical protein [Vitiosangium sp. GDMCC 1.1324]PTL79002.1 hypothetical protein DAT35_35875 [Vitiosangium sp. GDMCC 1.1324]
MLTIRAAQMHAFEELMELRFAERVVVALRSEGLVPPEVYEEQVLRELVCASVREAERLGIEFEWDLYRFVRYALRWGPRFHAREEFSQAGAVLADSSLDGTTRMDRLETLLPQVG